MLGPFGRLRFDAYRLPVTDAWPNNIDRLDESDLAEVADLLVSGVDHSRRLREGDVLVGARSDDGQVVGIVWVNVNGNPDSYGGRLTRPTRDTTYLNQLVVRPTHRGHGFGSDLVRGAQAITAQLGRTYVDTVVRPDNASSIAAMVGAGGWLESRLYGVRFGNLGSLRLIRRVPRAATSR